MEFGNSLDFKTLYDAGFFTEDDWNDPQRRRGLISLIGRYSLNRILELYNGGFFKLDDLFSDQNKAIVIMYFLNESEIDVRYDLDFFVDLFRRFGREILNLYHSFYSEPEIFNNILEVINFDSSYLSDILGFSYDEKRKIKLYNAGELTTRINDFIYKGYPELLGLPLESILLLYKNKDNLYYLRKMKNLLLIFYTEDRVNLFLKRLGTDNLDDPRLEFLKTLNYSLEQFKGLDEFLFNNIDLLEYSLINSVITNWPYRNFYSDDILRDFALEYSGYPADNFYNFIHNINDRDLCIFYELLDTDLDFASLVKIYDKFGSFDLLEKYKNNLLLLNKKVDLFLSHDESNYESMLKYPWFIKLTDEEIREKSDELDSLNYENDFMDNDEKTNILSFFVIFFGDHYKEILNKFINDPDLYNRQELFSFYNLLSNFYHNYGRKFNDMICDLIVNHNADYLKLSVILNSFYKKDTYDDDYISLIFRRYSGDALFTVLAHPYLNGLNEELIENSLSGIPFGSNKFSDISKLLAVYRKGLFNNIDIDDDIAIHNLANKINDFTYLKDYNYIGEFLTKSHLFPSSSIFSQILKNWEHFPLDMRKRQDPEELTNYLIDYIYKKKLNLIDPNDKGFVLEAISNNINLDRYSEYEKLYLDAQNVPLPGWTNIQPVQIYDYVGHFTPRSDVRTMFIGSDEYLTCCQKIGGAAEKSAIHSQTSPFGALFLVENIKTGGILSLSWVWSNGNTVVFDNIESKVMKTGASANDRLADVLLKIYQEAGQRMKGIEFNDGKNVVEEVLVGSNTYGIDQRYLQELPLKDVEREKKYPEDVGRIYSDAERERRKLAKIYGRMTKLCNKIDGFSSDLSDRLEGTILSSVSNDYFDGSSWIDPSGKILPLEGDEMHHEKALDVRKDYNLDDFPDNSYNSIMSHMLKNRFIRKSSGRVNSTYTIGSLDALRLIENDIWDFIKNFNGDKRRFIIDIFLDNDRIPKNEKRIVSFSLMDYLGSGQSLYEYFLSKAPGSMMRYLL